MATRESVEPVGDGVERGRHDADARPVEADLGRPREAGALRRFYNPYSELRRAAGPGAVTHRTNTRVEIPISSGGPPITWA